jgi:hypothetical protein
VPHLVIYDLQGEDNYECTTRKSDITMKWLRYQRVPVISLETQVGVTSQINKWANMDPRTCWRWDQVPRRSKNPLKTGHTRREPSSIIVNVELSAVCQSNCTKCSLTIGMKNARQHIHGSMKVCNYELDHCNSHRTCETLTSNETV